jgi:spermidine synthase
MALDDRWFTEVNEDNGAAFSLKVREKLHEEQTPFQRITIYETEQFGTLMTIDDLYMVSDRENFLYHEMMSHPALFTHADPKDVLIIGGGDCGTLREVLKHPGVRRAQQVEIDERVTRLAEKYFPELCASNNDPRAELHFVDGIRWVKDAAPGSYDLIIVDSTDPVGPAEGLFTEAFHRDCHRILRAGGLFIQQSESPLFHMKLIASLHGALKRAGYADVRTLPFPQPIYPSGWWSATMAGKDRALTQFRDKDAAAKKFETVYYNAEMHRAALALPEFMRRQLG